MATTKITKTESTRRLALHRPDLVGKLWHRYRLGHGAKPLIGACVIGGLTVAVAAETGVAELAFGMVVSYAAYRMLRYGIPMDQAFSEALRIEKEARI